MRNDIPGAIAAFLPFPLFSPGADTASSMDVIRTAESSGGLTTLLAALEAAGLTETLKGSGPFTIFAPTDAAFGKLPTGAMESLLRRENKNTLAAILQLHVVSGNLKAAAVMTMSSVKTLNGQAVTLSLDGNYRQDQRGLRHQGGHCRQ